MVVGFDEAYGILLAASGRLVGGLLAASGRFADGWGLIGDAFRTLLLVKEPTCLPS